MSEAKGGVMLISHWKDYAEMNNKLLWHIHHSVALVAVILDCMLTKHLLNWSTNLLSFPSSFFFHYIHIHIHIHFHFAEHSRNRLRNPQFASSFNAQDGFKIVVEESNNCDDDIATNSTNQSTPRDSLDIGSPLNPYLLSPWRETRKHSLPSQQVTEGITASQVRRLSERGGEGSGPSPKVCVRWTPSHHLFHWMYRK